MKKQILVWLVLSVLLVLVAASCSAGSDATTLYPADSGLDGATVFAEKCSKCHALDLVKSVHYDAAKWEETVTRMVAKGAELNAEEQAVVTDYLIKKYAE